MIATWRGDRRPRPAVLGRPLALAGRRAFTCRGFPSPWRAVAASMSAIVSSVSFWTSVSWRLRSSSEMSVLLLVGLERRPCRRGGRCAPRCAPSRHIGRRAWRVPCGAPRSGRGSAGAALLPSTIGLSPSPAERIAFSTGPTFDLVPHLHREQPRLGRRDRRDLVERHLRAVDRRPSPDRAARSRRGRCAGPTDRCFSASTAPAMRRSRSALS